MSFNFMAILTVCSDFGAQENKNICHEVMGPDAVIFVLCMLSFKPTFSLSSFTLMKRLFAAAAAAAKSLQSCPTLCGPINGSPPGFPIPGILQARTLELVAISFSNA